MAAGDKNVRPLAKAPPEQIALIAELTDAAIELSMGTARLWRAMQAARQGGIPEEAIDMLVALARENVARELGPEQAAAMEERAKEWKRDRTTSSGQ